MPEQTLIITQVFRATRTCRVVIPYAASLEAAIEAAEDDIPPFDHPCWTTEWDLMNEEVAPSP